MKFGWPELLLAALAGVVFAMLGIWAWVAFRTRRINRESGPDRRRDHNRGGRRND